jgi:hypothetical protein
MSRSRKRRAHASFDWIPVLDDNEEDQLPPDIHIQHTRVDLDESGQSSSTTSFVPAPASPAKKTRTRYDDFDWNNEPAPLELNTTNYPFLDPAYQHFLDVNEPGPPRRKRTTEVRLDFENSLI